MALAVPGPQSEDRKGDDRLIKDSFLFCMPAGWLSSVHDSGDVHFQDLSGPNSSAFDMAHPSKVRKNGEQLHSWRATDTLAKHFGRRHHPPSPVEENALTHLLGVSCGKPSSDLV